MFQSTFKGCTGEAENIMTTCDRCGRPSKYSRCTLCESIERERQEDIEREEQAHSERLEQLREDAERIADAKVNPGDYDCPSCLYRTLRYRASRCPTCQGTVTAEYWDQVDARQRERVERERAVQEAAKEKWESEAPARAKAALVAEEKAARDRAVARAYKFLGVYFAYIFPIVVFLTDAIMQYSLAYVIDELPKHGIVNLLLLLCPVLNWLALLGLIITGRPTAFEALAICAGTGCIVAFLIGKS